MAPPATQPPPRPRTGGPALVMPVFSVFLALRFLVKRPINVVAVFGVAVAVWALIVVIAVFSGFIAEIRTKLHETSPDLKVTGLPAEPSFAAIAPVLREDPDVVAIAPRVEHYGLYFLRGRLWETRPHVSARETDAGAVNFVRLIGIDPGAELRTTRLRRWLESAPEPFRVADVEHPFRLAPEVRRRGLMMSGYPLEPGAFLPPFDGILLGSRRLERDSEIGGGYRKGRLLELVSARFVPDGGGGTRLVEIKETLHEAGAFHGEGMGFEERVALLPLERMRTIMGHDIDDPASIDLVTSVAVRVRDGALLGAVATRLEDALEEAGLPAAVLTWEEQNRTWLNAVDTERNLMRTVMFVVVLVAAFLIYATLHMMVVQKTREIGILAAMGGTRRAIQNAFVLCGLVIAVLGSTLGLGLGIGSVYRLNDFNDWTSVNLGFEVFPPHLYNLSEIPWRLEPWWLAWLVVSTLVLTLLVSWLPARRAARMQPVEALRS